MNKLKIQLIKDAINHFIFFPFQKTYQELNKIILG